MDHETHEDIITNEEFSEIASILSGAPAVEESDKLDDLQAELRELLGDSSSFGAPISVNMPDGKKIVYRQRKPIEHPEVEFDARRAIPKRAEVQKAVHDSCMGKKNKKKKLSDSIEDKFTVAHELVEYVSGGGALGNVSRMVQQQPPEIHGIEDVADSIDWYLLNKGINSEHLETGISKDQKKIILFMDDRAEPRMTAIKEVLSKFGEPRVLQRADDVSEATNQPHGFYVFEVEPDPALFTPKTRDDTASDKSWAAPDKQKLSDSIEEEDDFIFEDEFEPFCSTCGEQLFEGSLNESPFEIRRRIKAAIKRKVGREGRTGYKLGKGLVRAAEEVAKGTSTAAQAAAKHGPRSTGTLRRVLGGGVKIPHGARVTSMGLGKIMPDRGGPGRKGQALAYHLVRKGIKLGDSLACSNCNTDATPLDEHEFNGIFCARHGERLDKYSRACYECQHEAKEAENIVVVCPECTSETTMESLGCGICGCEFNDGTNDFSAHVAESLFYNEADDTVLETENDWSDPFAVELANTLFAEVDEDPFD